MGRVKRPLNADVDDNARCVKANYYKMGWTNFTRNIGGGKGRVLRDMRAGGVS